MTQSSVTAIIRERVSRLQTGEPFTNRQFLKLGSRAAVDKALSRLVKEGVINRIMSGVFMRPKKSRFVDSVMPDIDKVIEVISKDNNETIQIHGAEAARRFKLSTQMPVVPVFYTSGLSRELKIGNLKVKLVHASNRKLSLSGSKSGLALSALWYLGKNNMNEHVINNIKKALSPEEYEALRKADVPEWMQSALNKYGKEPVYARSIL